MILEPMGGGGDAIAAATTQPAQLAAANAPVAPPTEGAAPATTEPSLSDVHIDQAKVDRLEKYWHEKVSPHSAALREAAEAHYKVLADPAPRAAAVDRRGRSDSARSTGSKSSIRT